MGGAAGVGGVGATAGLGGEGAAGGVGGVGAAGGVGGVGAAGTGGIIDIGVGARFPVLVSAGDGAGGGAVPGPALVVAAELFDTLPLGATGARAGTAGPACFPVFAVGSPGLLDNTGAAGAGKRAAGAAGVGGAGGAGMGGVGMRRGIGVGVGTFLPLLIAAGAGVGAVAVPGTAAGVAAGLFDTLPPGATGAMTGAPGPVLLAFFAGAYVTALDVTAFLAALVGGGTRLPALPRPAGLGAVSVTFGWLVWLGAAVCALAA